MRFKANMKVWVICDNGTRRPARTCNGSVWQRRGESVPVWLIEGNGHSAWDHCTWILSENLEIRIENMPRPCGRMIRK